MLSPLAACYNYKIKRNAGDHGQHYVTTDIQYIRDLRVREERGFAESFFHSQASCQGLKAVNERDCLQRIYFWFLQLLFLSYT